MRSFALVSSLLVASAWATPAKLFKKEACNADNCLRAVRASSHSPFPSSATSDCSSFMQKTVTPCPATTTTTTTVTTTGSPVFVTSTQAVLQTVEVTTLATTEYSLQTVVDITATAIQTTEVDVIDVVVSTLTVTQPKVAFLRRIEERSAPIMGTCTTATHSATSVPSYASACSGTARYSSACSCAGVTGGTSTASQTTVTMTSTVTMTQVPTSIVTAQVTSTVPVSETTTVIVPSISTRTDTLTVIEAVTKTSVVVVPTTVVVAPPPACTTYKFVCSSGICADEYFIGSESDDPDRYPGLVAYSSNAGDPSMATNYTINAVGRVYDPNMWGWVSENPSEAYFVFQMTDAELAYYAENSSAAPMYCSIDDTDKSYPGSLGALTCTFYGNANIFYFCAGFGSYLARGPTGQICNPITLAAMPAC